MATLPLLDRLLVSIDIETCPVESDEVRADIAAGIRPPGNMSKPDTIAAWERDVKPGLVEEAFARGGLSAATGRIVCFGIVHGEHEQVFCSDAEGDVLHLAFEYLSTLGDQITYIGHNLVGFDLPFIRQRAIVNRRRAPFSLRRAWSARPWDDHLGDTMLAWDADKTRRISLDRLCRLLGIASPKEDGMDGSKVWPMWQEGRHQEIADYCLHDCRAALECYRRIVEIV
jgi:3'-5' exonuclease